MINRMRIFKPIHIGRYTMKLTNYESEGAPYFFCGKKDNYDNKGSIR